jgi:cytoskeletal protein CcmA (bactofilin family)
MAQTRSAGRAHGAHGGDAGVIGSTAHVRGRITGDGNLTVEGQVEGDIAVRGDVVVGEGAKVTSNVDANSVSVAGTLEGDVNARGAVRIAAGAKVRGNMQGEHVSIEEGAEFAGRLDCEFELPPELTGSSSGSRKRS